jgi:hypothetical protein
MSRRFVTTIVAALVVAGCAEDREQSPTSPIGPDLLVGATCKYNDVKSYARDLFGASSVGYTLASQMAKFPANSAKATNLGFDIFREIEKERDATADAAWNALVPTAAKLTEQVIFCADVFLTAGNNEPASERLANLEKGLTKPTGGYAVRAGATASGDPDPEKAVLTSDLQSGVDKTSSTWAGWFGSRTLLYGYPTEEFTGELRNAIYGNAAYNWSLVRYGGSTTTYPGKGRVTVCITVDTDLQPASKFRLQKVATILETVTAVDGVDCIESTAGTPGTGVAVLPLQTRLAQFAAGLLLPERLHAAFLTKTTTKPTGSPSSFSVFQAGNPDVTQLAWLYPPADGTLRKGIPSTVAGKPVTVTVAGGQNTKWQGVKLRIYGIDNNGAKVPFGGSCVETNSAGEAAFPNLSAPKNGGFNLFVETHPEVAGCTIDPDVENFTQTTLPAPDRIIVRP